MEYLTCAAPVQWFTVYLLLRYGARVHMSSATAGYTLKDPYGVLRKMPLLLREVEDEREERGVDVHGPVARCLKAMLEAVDLWQLEDICECRALSQAHKDWLCTLALPQLQTRALQVIRSSLRHPLPDSVQQLGLPPRLCKSLLLE